MRVVELADEFGATTSETLEWCRMAGVQVADGGSELTAAEADAVRAVRQAQPVEPPPTPGWAPQPAPPDLGRSSAPGGLPGDVAPTGAAKTTGSALATIGLVLALVGLCVPFVPAVVGFVAGSLAKRQAAKAGTTREVQGRATAAQVVGVVFVVLWLGIFGLTRRHPVQSVTMMNGKTVDVEVVPLDQVAKGDCIVIQRGNAIKDWYRPSCDDPHDAEVVDVLEADPVERPSCHLPSGMPSGADIVLDTIVPAEDAPSSAHLKQVCLAHYRDGRAITGHLQS